MKLLDKLFGKKENSSNVRKNAMILNNKQSSNEQRIKEQPLMISQYVAHYVYEKSDRHKTQYIELLYGMGYTQEEAEKMFEFECDIVKKYNKRYLLEPGFVKAWFFSLSQPFFREYPKVKDDILKEHFLTMSELCKIIDEAEWHFWNSHERKMSDEVWAEIYGWHFKGKGGEFAVQYFEMIADETGIPSSKIALYSSHEGRFLSALKWRAMYGA